MAQGLLVQPILEKMVENIFKKNEAETLPSIAKAFRLGMEAKANEMLSNFIDRLSKEMVLFSSDLIGNLNPLLNETLSALSRKDFLRVADLLEYNIYPLIKQFSSLA